MKAVIEDFLSQVYELEGLLLVINNHGADATPYLYEMVQKKVQRINDYAQLCTPELYEFDKKHSEEFKSVENLSATDVQENTELRKNEIEPQVSDEPEIENDHISDFENENPTKEEASQVEYDGFVEYDSVDKFSDENRDELKSSESTYLDEDVLEVEDLDPFCDITEKVESEREINNEFIEVEEKEEEIIRLDEALQRSMSKDLSKAFSLNDRFRYRRELFGNSEVEMRNTINMVEAMHSYSEAEDYFYGDLEWDRESPEVADFMTIIRNHFL